MVKKAIRSIRNYLSHLDLIEKIEPKFKHSALGAGFVHKKCRYQTHTHLTAKKSALVTFTNPQKLFFLFLSLVLILSISLSFKLTAIILVALLTLVYFADFIFTFVLVSKSLVNDVQIEVSDAQLASLDEKSLPIYTILCPLYKEAAVLPEFVKNISGLDWPENKLDVQLLLEEDDDETINAARRLKLPAYFRIVVVPNSQPKTKPKACNYGLAHAKGEYLVIYDAEDRPDPAQLKKAYIGFNKLGSKVFCLQSKLNYYNSTQNLLTRLFSAEYSLWFDLVLPGLQSIEATIPLGGTSNHFRTKQLKDIHAWDPFNVTEDCDLGVRIFKEGYKTAIVNSTTYEEANSKPRNWLRQRSRWIKGYLQTYLVHMRSPWSFIKSHGMQAFIFQLVVGMRMVFILVNPILWVMTVAYFALYAQFGHAIETLYPSVIFYMAVVSLVFGNFVYIYNYMIACARRESWGLVKFIFLAPFYWFMSSIAALIAFYQLITKPHYWEKTKHGLHLEIELETDIYSPEPLSSPKKKRVLISTTVLFVATFFVNAINFVYNIILGRSLTYADFGLLSVFGSLSYLFAVITDSLASTVTYKTAFLFGKHKRYGKKFIISLARRMFMLSLLLVVLWVLASPTASVKLKAYSILPFILFTPVWALEFQRAIFSGFLGGAHKFGTIAFITIVEALFKLVGTLILVNLGLVDWIYAIIPLSIALSLSLYLIVSRKELGRVNEEDVLLESSFPLGFFGSSVASKLSVASFLTLDLILAKIYLSPENAGKYALLSLTGKIIYFAGSSFAQFITPFAAKLSGQGKAKDRSIVALLGLTTLAVSAGFVTLGLFSHYSAPFIFGSKALPIVGLLPLYTFGIACFTVALALAIYHQSNENFLYISIIFLMSLIVDIALILFGRTIDTFAFTVSLVSISTLVSVLFTHLFSSKIRTINRNFEYFMDIFSNPLRKKALSSKGFNILMFNWRDITHHWRGGAEVYVHEIAKEWVKQGHNVTLFCGNDGTQRKYEVIDGVHIVRRGGFYTVYFWACVYYLFKFRSKYDFIVESDSAIPFFTPLYVRRKKYLVVHHVHQDVFREYLRPPFSWIARTIESRILPLMYKDVKLVAVSESTKLGVFKLGCKKDPEDIAIVNPAVNGHFKILPKYKYPSFIYMGRIKPYKNIDIAVKAFAQILSVYPAAKLTIAGEGEALDGIRRLVNKLGVEKNVRILGPVTEEQKVVELAKNWVALQPSSFEGWGITVIEANASGTPVIASKVPGLIDSVDDGRTGILVPARDVEMLKSAMLLLVGEKQIRNSLSKNAIEWAQKYTWPKSAQKLLNIVVEDMGVEGSLSEPAYELQEN